MCVISSPGRLSFHFVIEPCRLRRLENKSNLPVTERVRVLRPLARKMRLDKSCDTVTYNKHIIYTRVAANLSLK
jgi:hypothetical protein